MGDIAYRQISLPDFDGMAEQWASGVTKGEEALWNSLRDWIIKYMNSASRAFTLSVDEMLDLVGRSLDEQVRVIEDDLVNQMKQWQSIDSRMSYTNQINKELESSVLNK